MSVNEHTQDEPKFGQGPPPAGGWKRHMTDDPTEYSPEFQDEYRRLWHEAAAERDALAARVAELTEQLTVARRTVSAYYDDHVIEGDPPCPCSCCEKARKMFATALRASGEHPARADVKERNTTAQAGSSS